LGLNNVKFSSETPRIADRETLIKLTPALLKSRCSAVPRGLVCNAKQVSREFSEIKHSVVTRSSIIRMAELPTISLDIVVYSHIDSKRGKEKKGGKSLTLSPIGRASMRAGAQQKICTVHEQIRHEVESEFLSIIRHSCRRNVYQKFYLVEIISYRLDVKEERSLE